MLTYFPDHVDRALHLPAYWAECELLLAKDLAAARTVWEDVLKQPAGRSLNPPRHKFVCLHWLAATLTTTHKH